MQFSSALKSSEILGSAQSLSVHLSLPDGAVVVSAGDRMRRAPGTCQVSTERCLCPLEVTKKLVFPLIIAGENDGVKRFCYDQRS